MLRTMIVGIALLIGAGFATAEDGEATDQPIVLTYPVADLFVPPTKTFDLSTDPALHLRRRLEESDRQPDFEPLIQLVRSTVASAGREEDVTIRAHRSSASLVVRARESDHNLIADRLEQWRRTLDVQVVLERHPVAATQDAWQEVVEPVLATEAAPNGSSHGGKASTPFGLSRPANRLDRGSVVLRSEPSKALLTSLQMHSRAAVSDGVKATLFNGQTARFVDESRVLLVQPVVSADRRSLRVKIAYESETPIDTFASTRVGVVPDGHALLVEGEPTVANDVQIRRLLVLLPRIQIVEEEEQLLSRQ